MKPEFTDLELLKNEKEGRFEMRVGQALAMIYYKETSDIVQLVHTEVEEALEGKGAGTAIIEKTLHYIERNLLRLIPLCPFVVAYIKRHPEWKRILADGIKNV